MGASHPLFIFFIALLFMTSFEIPLKEQEYSFLQPSQLVKVLLSEVLDALGGIEFNSFLVGISWPKNKLGEVQELRKTVQYGLVETLSQKTKANPNFEAPDANILIDFDKKALFLELKPVFVKGNYFKFSRLVAQTKHFCFKCKGRGCPYCNEKGTLSEESVEQLLEPLFISVLSAEKLILHGAGREDVDVLMLGEGRPFIVEITQPRKRKTDLLLLQEKINTSLKNKVSVLSLAFSTKEEIAPLKNNPHEKIYSAIVSCEKKPLLNLLQLNKKFSVVQRTPVRVEKRRVDLDRKKEVTLLFVSKINETEFELKLLCSHGTYVKEFISGDSLRTVPSISSMLSVECKCKQLDVLKII